MEERFKGQVRDISSEGHGVVDHPSGMVFFVKGVWPGDEGEFVVESRKKKYGSARLEKLLRPSPHRREVSCPHFGWQEGLCGGCPWLMADEESQRAFKQKRIQYLLERNQLIHASTQVKPIQASIKNLGYRNRAQFKTNGEKLGYVSPESKVIVDIEDCIVLTDKNRQTLKDLRRQLPNQSWRPEPPYLWNYIDIDEDVSAQAITLNRRRPFKQANDVQNDFMKVWLREKLLGVNKHMPTVELFAGSGNFTSIFVEQEFSKIYSAEVDQKAVQNLQKNNWPGVQGFVVDLFRPGQWKQIPVEVKQAELLFLDPPREGFSLLEKYVDNFPNLKKIIYISCEPYQWAKDIRGLVQKKWQLKEVQPVDQFPQTPHVEVLSVMTR